MHKVYTAIFLTFVLTTTASAQTAAWRFHWQQGQTLHYRVEHTTYVAEVVGGSKVETRSKVNLVRRWHVVAVDAQGVATIEMSITAMRNEQTRPNGEVMVFDSRELDKSTPALAEQLSKMIGQTLVVLCVDGLGRVVEVPKSTASRYEAEPPFGLTLPGNAINVGQSWERPYNIVLDPPLGAGEKYPATQKYACSKLEDGVATCAVTTNVPKMPESKADQLTLLQKLLEGEVGFDVQHGRLQSSRFVIDRQVQGHQGEGSSYRFQSTYTEQFAE
jgi:hypothetical protein